MAITATDQMSPISASIHTVPEPRSPAPRGESTRFTVPSPARSRSSERDNGVHAATHLLTADEWCSPARPAASRPLTRTRLLPRRTPTAEAANQPTPTASQTPTRATPLAAPNPDNGRRQPTRLNCLPNTHPGPRPLPRRTQRLMGLRHHRLSARLRRRPEPVTAMRGRGS